jgi:hypothetical protein
MGERVPSHNRDQSGPVRACLLSEVEIWDQSRSPDPQGGPDPPPAPARSLALRFALRPLRRDSFSSRAPLLFALAAARPATASARLTELSARGMDETGFHVAGLRTPMRFGGTSVPEMVVDKHTSIFRPADMDGTPRVNLPAENPKYPETKHTLK